MKRLVILALLLTSPALAQSAAVPDIHAAVLAGQRAERACATNKQQAKCKLETAALNTYAQRADAIVNPTPTPTPTPPTGGYVPAGQPDFIADFPVNEALVPSWGTGAIPGPYSPDEGAFRFTCGGEDPDVADDPALYPDQPGKSHLHDPFGARPFSASLHGDALKAVTSSSCNYGNRVVNRSSYWKPSLLIDTNGVPYSVNSDWIAVYYKRFKASSYACTPGNPRQMGECVGLPNGLVVIAGWDPTKPDGGSPGSTWYCTGGSGGHFANLDEVFRSGCKAGDTLIADVMFPNCWNGKHVDTPDHRSHLAFPGYGDWGYLKCPATHPFVIPQPENKYAYTVTADMYETVNGVVRSRIYLSSDHMKPNAKPGETLHGDYEKLWDARVEAIWMAGCINKGLDCSGGDLGNGLQIRGASQPAYGWVNPNPRVPVPSS